MTRSWPNLSPARAVAPDALPGAPDRRLLKRLWRHRSGRRGLILGAMLLALTLLGMVWTPYEPDWPDYTVALQGPSLAHPFGTDDTGRDLLSRVMDGAHRSLGAALAVLGGVFSIGLVYGCISGLARGLTDTVMMRLADVMMSLPGLVLAFAVIGVLGPGFVNLLIALIVADWAWYARLARAMALGARDRPEVIAARMAGVPRWRILSGHILPGIALHLGVVASLALGGMIGAISGLSFLGLGVQPPHAEWGAMLSTQRLYFAIAPWLLWAPALMIFLSVLASNLISNALRDILAVEGRR
ncbi:peptide/nickel transport system permease protein/nickel transport system permease protein [Pseudooceanicola antarcticus]|uniref:ABC transporter permease n=1 Tax=Pseudooceanicola antarcticus TaxID=1247613 RepID=A0A285J880_9RHOB|nr:ABC transporter permease [Pseudooceanicola antarcticus]PJE27089.1 ABC transporter permease [Pseudooceanicola antarcticus]SNY56448.1 peptide/nickel transport system permease protein/nickel transport system permease protein [Pseudooceanicola antarcticus]